MIVNLIWTVYLFIDINITWLSNKFDTYTYLLILELIEMDIGRSSLILQAASNAKLQKHISVICAAFNWPVKWKFSCAFFQLATQWM